MLIYNKMEAWITVNDIGVKIPPKGKGGLPISDERIVSSKDIMDLINGGYLEVKTDPSVIFSKEVDGETNWVIGGHTIWQGNTTVNKEVAPPSKTVDPKTLVNKIKGDKDGNKKYVIAKKSPAGIFLNSINISLTRQNQEITLDSSQYYDLDVQKKLADGSIQLKAILECKINEVGEETWVNSNSNEESKMFKSGEPCAFWEGPIFDAGGYANMNRQYIFNLSEMGVKIKPTLITTLMDVEDDIRDKLIGYSNNMIPVTSPKVYATNVPQTHIGRSVAYTMMETENKIHPLLAHQLLVADEIWVPCQWNKDTFEASGVNRDVKVMPLGVDIDEYKPRKRNVFWGEGEKGFTFLSVFSWNWRKGYDVMLKAYARAFDGDDDVSFVMISRFMGQTQYSHRIFEDVRKIANAEGKSNLPHLVLIDEVIPTFMMPLMYQACDAFLFLTRGEGYGCPPIEAMASGKPVITADHGGQKTFANNSNTLLIKPDKVVKVDESIRWISPFYNDMEFVDYSNKAIDEISEKMRYAYENRDAINELAVKARKDVVEKFSWQSAAERVKDRLTNIQP